MCPRCQGDKATVHLAEGGIIVKPCHCATQKATQLAARIIQVAGRPGHVASLPMVNAVYDAPASPVSAHLPQRTPKTNIRPDEIFGEMPGASGTRYTHPEGGVLPPKFYRQFAAYLNDHGLRVPDE